MAVLVLVVDPIPSPASFDTAIALTFALRSATSRCFVMRGRLVVVVICCSWRCRVRVCVAEGTTAEGWEVEEEEGG